MASQGPVWIPEIADRVASFLPGNVVACTLRFLDKASAAQFADIHKVQLSQPVPRSAFAEHWLAPEACRNLNLEQRQKLVRLVASSGDVANLTIAIQAAGCALHAFMLEAAAAVGALDCCTLIASMLRLDAWWWGMVLPAAARGGHWTVCQWCLANGAERSWRAVEAAYAGGHPDLAETLKPAGEPGEADRYRVLQGAAEGCDLAVLQSIQAWANVPAKHMPAAFAAAVGSPTPDWEAKAKFLFAKSLPLVLPNVANFAVRLPPDTALQRLEWLKAWGCPPNMLAPEARFWAAHIEVARWLVDNAAVMEDVWDIDVEPSRFPSLDVVQLLVREDHAEPAQAAAAALAAGSRGLPALRWLVETYGAEVVLDPDAEGIDEANEWEFNTAAEMGCVGALQLLREAAGMEFDAATWIAVTRSGSEEALDWLQEEGCPMPEDGGACYVVAAGNGDARTLRVLRGLGLPWGEGTGDHNDAFAAAVHSGVDLDTLRWMVAEGCPVDWAKAEAAAAGSSLDRADVQAWLAEQRAVEGGGEGQQGGDKEE